MNAMDKKKYNRENYLKNKNKIRERSKQRYQRVVGHLSNVVPLFESLSMLKPQKASDACGGVRVAKEGMSKWFVWPLVWAITLFLVVESARFYQKFDTGFGIASAGEAWFKAAILEGSMIFFASANASARRYKVLYRVMTCLIFGYGVWVMSGSVVHSSLQARQSVEFQNIEIAGLESEAAQKESLRNYFLKTDRISLVRKYDSALDDIHQRIGRSRSDMKHLSAPVVIWNGMATLIIFRIIVLLTNIFCLNSLKRREPV